MKKRQENGGNAASGGWVRFVAIGLFAAAVVRFVALLSGALDYRIAHTLSDDAFYYLEIGKNAWERGVFPSFDGLHQTNGFHLLYQLVLLPLMPLYTQSLEHTYTVILALDMALFMAGAVLLWRVLDTYLPPRASLPCLAFVLGSTLVLDIVTAGLETALSFLLSMFVLWLLFCRRAPAWAVGGALGLLVMARLDIGVLFALAVGSSYLIAVLRNPRDRSSRRELLNVVAAGSALVVPLLLFNFAVSGHPGTISAATKMYAHGNEAAQQGYLPVTTAALGGYAFDLAARTLGDFLRLPYALQTGEVASASDPRALLQSLRAGPVLWIGTWLGLIAGGVVAYALLLRRELRIPSAGRVLPPLWIALLVVVPAAHLLIVSLLVGRHAGSWYWLHLALGAAVLVALLASRPRIGGVVAGAALSVLGFSGLVATPATMASVGAFDADYQETSWYTGPLEAARWINAYDDGRIIVGSFNAGILGYVAEPPVVNLDGLVNNFDYLEARREGQVRRYIERKGLTHISDVGRADKYLTEMGFGEEEVHLAYRTRRGDSYLIALPPVPDEPDTEDQGEETKMQASRNGSAGVDSQR